MEWLGLLLLYLISGFMKKRQQATKRREIESDPDWEVSEKSNPEKSKSNLDQVLQDLFDQTVELEPETLINEEIEDKEESDQNELEIITEQVDEFEDQILKTDENDFSNIDEKVETFEEKIYHSELADREEQHFGNKWRKKDKLHAKLFNSNKSLKKAIILKEILDKPVGLR